MCVKLQLGPLLWQGEGVCVGVCQAQAKTATKTLILVSGIQYHLSPQHKTLKIGSFLGPSWGSFEIALAPLNPF